MNFLTYFACLTIIFFSLFASSETVSFWAVSGSARLENKLCKTVAAYLLPDNQCAAMHVQLQGIATP